MTNKLIILLAFSTIIAFYCSCDQVTTKENNEKEIQEIANTISSNIGWFKEKDFDLLFRIVAHDSNYIVVNPRDKVIKGYNQFLENAEIFKRPEFQYVRHELKDLKITLSRSGDVAWYYCVLDDINTWDGQSANWENARWTGVLEKRNGQWTIVQMHFSFPKE